MHGVRGDVADDGKEVVEFLLLEGWDGWVWAEALRWVEVFELEGKDVGNVV